MEGESWGPGTSWILNVIFDINLRFLILIIQFYLNSTQPRQDPKDYQGPQAQKSKPATKEEKEGKDTVSPYLIIMFLNYFVYFNFFSCNQVHPPTSFDALIL